MFTLDVEAESKDFMDYLEKESTKVESQTYTFSTFQLASFIIARFILFFLKKQYFLTMIAGGFLEPQNRQDFSSYVSVEENRRILLLIIEEVQKYLENHHVFHLEGFIRFRLKDVELHIHRMMDLALDAYTDALLGVDNIAWFQDILAENPFPLEQLELHIQDDEALLQTAEQCYLKESVEEEDTVLSHCLLLSPKKLFIYDATHRLSKEMVIIIKKTFLDKVIFYD